MSRSDAGFQPRNFTAPLSRNRSITKFRRYLQLTGGGQNFQLVNTYFTTWTAIGLGGQLIVPQGVWWRPIKIAFLFQTGGLAANRTVQLQIEPWANVLSVGSSPSSGSGTGIDFISNPGPVQIANQIRTYQFLAKYPLLETAFDAQNTWRGYMPDWKLPPGALIQPIIAAQQGGDSTKAGADIWLEEYILKGQRA